MRTIYALVNLLAVLMIIFTIEGKAELAYAGLVILSLSWFIGRRINVK